MFIGYIINNLLRTKRLHQLLRVVRTKSVKNSKTKVRRNSHHEKIAVEIHHRKTKDLSYLYPHKNRRIMIENFKSSVLAGICIGIAGFGYLAEKSIIGAVLFAFGLLAVVHYKLKLYTGTAGFIKRGEVGTLLLILLGNIVGCLLVALLARCSPLPLQETATDILTARMNTGILRCGLLAIGCGFIMTTAVAFARKQQFLPLLFGVPLFIMCGFPHCVADIFYYLCVPVTTLATNWTTVLPLYLAIVLGNFLGCNLYRLIIKQKHQP